VKEFDPAWEYYEPDPEIAACVYGRPAARDVRSLTGQRDAGGGTGLSVVSRPDGVRSYLGPERPAAREARRFDLRTCRQCGHVYRPAWEGQRFCGLNCARKAKVTGRRKVPIAPRACERCRALFTPTAPSKAAVQRFCSRACARRGGKP
jgi:hypothetical protein